MTVYCNRVSGCVSRGGTWVFGGGKRGGASCSCRVNGGVSLRKMAIMATYLTAKQVTEQTTARPCCAPSERPFIPEASPTDVAS